MKLAVSSKISEIDAFCERELGITTESLMEKSGDAVAHAVRKRTPAGQSVIVLAGKGNNGGDGYAAACALFSDYSVRVYDVFGKGQKSEAGKKFRARFLELGGEIVNYEPTDAFRADIGGAACIVDAVFGTGFAGEMPEELRPLAIAVREAVGAHKIAVDVPLGINPDDGSVSDFAITVSATVALSFIKPGIISYPARAFVGEIIYSDLGIPEDVIGKTFDFRYHMIDSGWVKRYLPVREENSNKGSFGKLLMITGSKKYRGAAHLAAEAALRGGVGLVTFLGARELISELSAKFPEMIYKEKSVDNDLTDADIAEICKLSASHGATLIGSGSDNTEGLLRLVLALLSEGGSPLILDADAINALATMGEGGILALKKSKRTVILTPHPLEFSRLSLSDVASVQLHRLEAAEKFAGENKVILVLKGAGTVITDGKEVYINVAGSSSLAKAGTGDVLAGLLAAFVAQDKCDPKIAASLAVYFHAMAGQTLAGEFSAYGVTPSDLPKEIGRSIAAVSECIDEF